MGYRRNIIALEPTERLLKTSILMFSLFAVQASIWYFLNTASLEGYSNGKLTFEQRKLLEFSARPKSGLPTLSNDLPITNYTRKHNQQKECSALRHLKSSEEKCRFIKSNDNCGTSEGFFQYLQFPYCSLPSLVSVAFVILVLWLIFLFITLGTTADDYFCPALTVIARNLRLSQNIAGVTFLAYGNGAPDIFSALAALTHSKSESTVQLGIQALFGAGLFVTTVVVGTISFMPAFTLTKRPFTRDVLFYLGAVAWAAITLHNQRISLYESIGFIVFYIVYVLVVIVGHCIYQRWKPKLRQQCHLQPSTGSVSSSIEWRDQYSDTSERSMTSAATETVFVPFNTGAATQHSFYTVSEAFLKTEKAVIAPAIHGMPNPVLLSTPDLESPSGENIPLLGGQPRVSEWRKFLLGLEPIDREEWSESKILRKCFIICKAPAVFCLNLTVPVVDYSKENHNWNKWLNVVHCVTVPLFSVMATKAGSCMIGDRFHAWALALVAGLFLASIVAITTKKNKRPRAHFVFAYLAFVTSVIWIYSTANEIVNLLQTLGIASGISDAVLGLTFLAWGNSIGDLVSNRAMAKQGFPRMAVSACFGGPLLNMLLGIGLSCTVVTVSQGHAIHLPHRYHQYIISAGFLAASLASSAVVIPLLGFRVPRTFGVFLFILYLSYLIVSITAEITHF